MKVTYFFPCILMLLNMGASLVYFGHGDLRRGIYWIAAIVLMACVTF